jgi:ketosteroid isomerase-like protein
MAGQLEQVAMEMFEALDQGDVAGVVAFLSDDAEGVDEISRRWLRGRAEVESYLNAMLGSVSDIGTELRDVHESSWGDAAVLTCWLDQTYTLDGTPGGVSAPTTMVFRREGGDWKLALFHSVPLPEGD